MMEERATVANYLILPTKYKFPVLVRIYAIVFSYITKCRKGRKILSQLLVEGRLFFQLFNATLQERECDPPIISLAMTVSPTGQQQQQAGDTLLTMFNSKSKNLLYTKDQQEEFAKTQCDKDDQNTDRYINQALLYLYRKGTEEVKAFNKPKQVKKMGYEVEGVLLSNDRLMQGMDFLQTAELDLNLGAMGIKTSLPLLDRYSPLSYAVSQYIHWDIARHKGAETCTRLSLEHVHILQGGGLYRELGEQCIWCKMKREKYLEAAYGPIKETQLTLAPPFYFAQMDLFGPIKVFVPGKERETRHGKPSEAAKCWIVTFVCPTTRLINMQVVETSLADGITSAVSRLGCEIDIPKKIYIDAESSVGWRRWTLI